MKPALRLAAWLAARDGMQLAYPPADEPPLERAGTRANDGTPCATWNVDPERYERRKAAAVRLET